MAGIVLRNREETRRMGQWLAAHLPDSGVRALLLRGPLGSGKTTLTSALVQALPGGDAAEVSSPSFTLCNHYPTTRPYCTAICTAARTACRTKFWTAWRIPPF